MVRTRRVLSARELPAKPDPHTGEPFPPPAPEVSHPLVRDRTKRGKRRDTSRGRRPAAPPGQAHCLAWYRPPRYQPVIIAGGVVAFMAVYLILGGKYPDEDDPLFETGWMTWPVMWVFLVLFGAFMAWEVRDRCCAAGAEWLKVGRRWVRLYELSKIRTRFDKSSYALEFTDRSGRSLTVRGEELFRNPRVWALAYLGIVHSTIAGGAEVRGLDQDTDLPEARE